MIYDFNLPKLGDVFGTWLYHGSQRPFSVTTDGLYVGTMLDGRGWGRLRCGESRRFTITRLLMAFPTLSTARTRPSTSSKSRGGGSSGPLRGSYRFSNSDVKLAASMRDVPEQQAIPKPVVAVTWLSKPPAIDGNLSDWNLANGVSLDSGNGKTAEISLGRDADKLYLAYKVHEPNPMRNGGADWRSLFVSGDCVDLMLQTDRKADPNRRDAVAGDERLLFTLFQDKPVAVLYRPVVPGTNSPVSLASARIDQVIQLDAAKWSSSEMPAHGFYTVEASVPLRDLNVNPKSSEDLRGDAGVIFADESGKSRSLRLYYYNKHTEMIDDLATEATLQPNEWGKIAMPMGPNLIHNGGFEEPLVDSKEDVDKGWYVNVTRNGNDAKLSSESPYSGHRSLLLEASTPVSFPPEAYNYPKTADFFKTANGGKGFGEVEVRQRVVVTGGHRYSVRFRFRSQDYPGSRSPPGHPRGYVAFTSRIEWTCPPPNRVARTSLASPYDTCSILGPVSDWYTVHDAQTFAPPAPYAAPKGATAADIIFYMRNVTDSLPKFFIDDIEFVDVTPGQARSKAIVPAASCRQSP